MPAARGVNVAPAFQPNPVEIAPGFAEAERRIVGHRVGDRVVTGIVPAVMLGEDHFVAELLQAGQEMQLRQQMPAQGVAHRIARDDGDGFAHAPIRSSIAASTRRASNRSSASFRAAALCAA